MVTAAWQRSEKRRASQSRWLQRGRDEGENSSQHADTDTGTATRCKRAAAVAATAAIAGAGSADEISDEQVEEYLPSKKETKREPLHLSATAEVFDASHVGARMGSKILTAFKEDIGLLGLDNSGAVTKSKVQTSLDKSRDAKLQGLAVDTAGCSAVFCDGRLDKELVRGGSRTVGNVSVNMHPGDVHAGHFSCQPGEKQSGEAYARKLHDFLAEREIDIHNLAAIGGDGTNQVRDLKYYS